MTALQDKLNQANNKVAEFRNQCDKLKKDLKVAHKVRSNYTGPIVRCMFRITHFQPALQNENVHVAIIIKRE